MITTELERAGIPVVQVCAMTPVAKMVGSSRILPSGGIVHPLGNGEATPDEEHDLRRRILETALTKLTQPGAR